MTPEERGRVRDLCVKRATTKLSLDEEHAVIYELANAAPWLLDELGEKDVAIERLESAILAHRHDTECCAECSAAQAAERSTPDGVLWSVIPEAAS